MPDVSDPVAISGVDGERHLAVDLSESRTVQSGDQPGAAGPLRGEILGPDQGGASCDQTVIFELGQHDSRSLHANVDALQVEGEGVCKLHSCHHLFTDFAWARHLNGEFGIVQSDNFHGGDDLASLLDFPCNDEVEIGLLHQLVHVAL